MNSSKKRSRVDDKLATPRILKKHRVRGGASFKTVQVSNLPDNTNKKGICGFLIGKLEKNRGISNPQIVHCTLNPESKSAIVEFADVKQGKAALSLDKFSFRFSNIRISRYRPPRKTEDSDSHCDDASETTSEGHSEDDGSQARTVQVSNLPDIAQSDAISRFLLLRLKRSRGVDCEIVKCVVKPGSGTALVEFDTVDDAESATSMDGLFRFRGRTLRIDHLLGSAKRSQVPGDDESSREGDPAGMSDDDEEEEDDDDEEEDQKSEEYTQETAERSAFVRGLHPRLTESALVNFFVGGMQREFEVTPVVKKCSIRSREGDAFVEFDTTENRDIALWMSGRSLLGRTMKVSPWIFGKKPSAYKSHEYESCPEDDASQGVSRVGAESQIAHTISTKEELVDIRILQEDNRKMRQEANTLKEKVVEAEYQKQAADTLRNENSRLRKQVGDLKREVEQLRSRGGQQDTQLVALQRDCSRLETELDIVKRAETVDKKAAEGKQAELTDEISTLQEEVAQLRANQAMQTGFSKTASSQDPLKGIQRELSDTKANNLRLQAELDVLKTKSLAFASIDFDVLGRDKKELEDENERLRRKLKEAEDRFIKISSSLSVQADLIGQDRITLRDLESTLEKERSSRRTAEKDLAELCEKYEGILVKSKETVKEEA